MKKLFTIIALIIIAATAYAQNQHKISYQAIIRDNQGKLLTNKDLTLQFTISQKNTEEKNVYTESINTTTNDNGLVTTHIGNMDTFNSI